MPQLTLYVADEAVVARAKAYAQAHNTSLSHLVTQYLATLTDPQDEDFFVKLHRDLEAKGFREPTDAEDDAARAAYLERKYR
jgi:hypothetical protein